MSRERHAITPTREEDYPEWYQQVVRAADLAENSPVRGSMVIKPWGYGIWESMRDQLDQRIKAAGCDNAYFPLFIPLSFFEKEAGHVEGFAKECAVVTHTRLKGDGDKLIPDGELEEPLVVRPTSETIIGHSFAKWVQSYRDLPLKVNQWANVVRWERRPRLFLRTTEFLWQEGHTVHAEAEEAVDATKQMLEMYREFCEEVLAMPVITGEKSPGERFPGAEATYAIEAMMQDRKALQAGTTHYLGQNFAKASEIQFNDIDGEVKYAYTSSWGVTTRLIGGVIMTHSDDDGLCLPPRLAPKQVVILPFIGKDADPAAVYKYAEDVAESLRGKQYKGRPIVVVVDRRDMRGGDKNWEWIKKGIPVRIEVGPRDMESGSVMIARRDRAHKDKEKVLTDAVADRVVDVLDDMQKGYFKRAKAYLDQNIRDDITTFEEMKTFFTPKNPDKPEIHGGFVKAKWCGDPETEDLLDDLKVTIRCLPLEQSGTEGTCILTGKPATIDAIFGKSY